MGDPKCPSHGEEGKLGQPCYCAPNYRDPRPGTTAFKGLSYTERMRIHRKADKAIRDAAPAMLEALRVMVLTPGILAHLEATDPMALRQARRAITSAETY